MLTDIDPQRQENYPWHTVQPPELGGAAGEIAGEVKITLDGNRPYTVRRLRNVLRLALIVLARHARPAQEKP